MATDRRNDIGGKITATALTLIMMVIMGSTIYKADGAEKMSYAVQEKTGRLEEKVSSVEKTAERMEVNINNMNQNLQDIRDWVIEEIRPRSK